MNVTKNVNDPRVSDPRRPDRPPLTRVTHVETQVVRLLRLSPREAVMECASEDMGQRGQWDLVEPLLVRLPNGWQCGRYIASDRRRGHGSNTIRTEENE